MDSRSAFIVIDMQNEFCINQEGQIKESCQDIANNINKVSHSFRRNGDKVFWLNWGVDKDLSNMSSSQKEKFNNFDYPVSMAWKKKLNSLKKVLEIGSWSAELVSDTETNEQDIFINKQRMSGFWFTDLDRRLKEEKISKLYFAGVNTDQCVLTTLQDAHFLGYDCYLVEDCTTTSSPDYCLQAALYNVRQCFGEVVFSEELL